MQELYGINTQEGLARAMHNETLYTRMLLSFHKNHAQAHDRLEAAQQKGDFDSCASITHALRGAASTIGAEHLASLGKQLEDHFRGKVMNEALEGLMLDFRKELSAIIQSVEEQLIHE